MFVELSSVAEINPAGPQRGSIAKDAFVSFVPMALLGEDGHMRGVEVRRYAEVSTGFTAFKKGDVLVAKITPCFENNKIGLANINFEYGFGSTEFHVIRCDVTRLSNIYLSFILRHDYVRVLGERRMTGSGGQRRVPAYFLENLKVPLLPLNEQNRVIQALQATDNMRLKHEEAARQSNELLRLLTDKAFRGEL